ncbi:Conserved protein of unknown function [Blastococcus saxobsidens DD2]|uniref:ChsH2 C-terminal OB-fold domain-containing protein n=2 Tax=Blastococcus saxobsidens TaxID=138336 RepID=H6RSY2_BLASD|nr:Conserved protein of unknown function [Blastococcus saxobsidens DD2]
MDVATRTSSGTGTVAAATTIHRAPPGTSAADVPFGIVLIDLDEGVRVMGRCVSGAEPGDRVTARFQRFGQQLVPLFEVLERRTSPASPTSTRPNDLGSRT